MGRFCASSLEHPQRAPGSHDCRDNGDSLDSAKSQTSDFNDRRLVGWAHDALNDWFEEREADGRPVPYNAAQLADAISLDYESGYKGRGDRKPPVKAAFRLGPSHEIVCQLICQQMSKREQGCGSIWFGATASVDDGREASHGG